MTEKIAVFIANYNMPERADALFEYIDRHTTWETDIYLIDNASDLVPAAVNTNVWIRPRNKQTTAAWLEGLRAAETNGRYFAYCFAITSADFPEGAGDPIGPLAEVLENDPTAVGVHPALTPDSTTSWGHLIARGGELPRRTWMIDNIFSMYRANWFDKLGRFDPELRYAWGIDLETCYYARAQHRALFVHEGVRVRKITDIAYRLERMRMSADERQRLAGQNMEIILERKYGAGWWKLMTEYMVTDDMR